MRSSPPPVKLRMKYTLSLQKIAYLLIIAAILTYLSVIAKSLIIPFVFAGFFAFLLKPICDKMEQKITNRGIAAFLSFFVVLIPLTALIVLFAMQFMEVVTDLPAIGKRLEEGVNNAFLWVNRQVGLSGTNSKEWISKNASKLMDAPLAFVGSSISSSTAFLTSLLLCLLYTFFLLLYRTSIKNFILIQVSEDKRTSTEKVLSKIQGVVQKYLSGMGTVMLILGVFNSFGLFLIGIEYAFFWGFMAAFLAIIPYVGTFIGGFLPFAFSMATADNYLQPALVVLLFAIVQTLEGNIITPKIVGSSVKVNPLAAILSMVTGGFIWGVAGLILALPTIAVLRVMMSQIDFLKPLSVLLSSDIYGNEEIFEEKYDSDRFRFWNFFKKKKTTV